MELLQAVSSMKSDPHVTKNGLRQAVFEPSGDSKLERDVQERVICAAMQLVFMIPCNIESTLPPVYAPETTPHHWFDEEKLINFIDRVFYTNDPRKGSRLIDPSSKASLSAANLARRGKVEIWPTDSLSKHLLLDRNGSQPILRVFHNTTFLKLHLHRFKRWSVSLDLSVIDSLERDGLSPKLLVETLMTLQHVLFPLGDEKSDAILVELANKSGKSFDRDCLTRDAYTREFAPGLIKPHFWAERLTKLREIVENPPPQGKIMAWIEEHTSERNALYVAILGLFLASFFGLLSVIIGIVQTVISYWAWKHPVPQP